MRASLVAASLIYVAGVSASALTARAGPLDGLSQSCQSTLGSAVSGPFGACLNLAGLAGIAAAGSNASLVQPLNTFLTGFCAATPCTTNDFASLGSSIVSGCSDDLKKYGIRTEQVTNIVGLIGKYYAPGRSVGCSKDTSNGNAFCVTTTSQALEKAIGEPLSIMTFTSSDFVTTVVQKAGKPEVLCTPCVQSAWVTAKGALGNQNILQGVQGFFSNLCGANFVSGAAPTQITTPALNSTSTGSGSSSSPSAKPNDASTSAISVSSLLGAMGLAFALV